MAWFAAIADRKQSPSTFPMIRLLLSFALCLLGPFITAAMPQDDQSAITKAYQELGKELKAKVAPVGIAWEMALKAERQLALHDPDKKHPNAAGTYLAACVIYGTIYGKSPEGLPGKIAMLADDK